MSQVQLGAIKNLAIKILSRVHRKDFSFLVYLCIPFKRLFLSVLSIISLCFLPLPLFIHPSLNIITFSALSLFLSLFLSLYLFFFFSFSFSMFAYHLDLQICHCKREKICLASSILSLFLLAW